MNCECRSYRRKHQRLYIREMVSIPNAVKPKYRWKPIGDFCAACRAIQLMLPAKLPT